MQGNSMELGTFEPTQETRMGRMLIGGRITTTMLSKKSGQHLTLTLHCMAKDGTWKHVPFGEATHVFIKMGHGEFGSQTIATYYPQTGKLYFKSNDKAWRYAALQTLRAAKTGEQETECYTLTEMERCGKCGRALTDPVSIARGLGPDCYGDLTGSVHYTHVEENLVTATQERVRQVSRPPLSISAMSAPVQEKVEPQTVTDSKGRTLPKTFADLAASVKR